MVNRLVVVVAACALLGAARLAFCKPPATRQAPVRVVVWDEQQPEQKQAYESFLGNAIADYLRGRPGFSVRSVKFSDPEPDAVIFEERWDAGEHFRSGCLWNIGKGKVFYFRPGHELYPVYRQNLPLRVIENACRWMGR